MVRKVSCLRPISLCCDMAQVIDALWLGRNADRLECFFGHSQTGGVSDPLSLVLALVIHAQLRAYQGMPTYWALLDQKWAFDVAIFEGMLSACFDAGVRCDDWLLLDDIFRMDRQCLQLHGFLSDIFVFLKMIGNESDL